MANLNHTKTSNKGFTLIELMIVIAIIGIIAAVAVPQYNTYTNRSFVTNEGLNAARIHQLAINEYYTRFQALPGSQADVDLSFSGETPSVQSVAISNDGNADITIIFKTAVTDVPALVSGKQLVISPATNSSGAIFWQANLTLSTVEISYLPNM